MLITNIQSMYNTYEEQVELYNFYELLETCTSIDDLNKVLSDRPDQLKDKLTDELVAEPVYYGTLINIYKGQPTKSYPVTEKPLTEASWDLIKRYVLSTYRYHVLAEAVLQVVSFLRYPGVTKYGRPLEFDNHKTTTVVSDLFNIKLFELLNTKEDFDQPYEVFRLDTDTTTVFSTRKQLYGYLSLSVCGFHHIKGRDLMNWLFNKFSDKTKVVVFCGQELYGLESSDDISELISKKGMVV